MKTAVKKAASRKAAIKKIAAAKKATGTDFSRIDAIAKAFAEANKKGLVITELE